MPASLQLSVICFAPVGWGAMVGVVVQAALDEARKSCSAAEARAVNTQSALNLRIGQLEQARSLLKDGYLTGCGDR